MTDGATLGAEVGLTLASEKVTPGLYYSIVSDIEVDGAYANERARTRTRVRAHSPKGRRSC